MELFSHEGPHPETMLENSFVLYQKADGTLIFHMRFGAEGSKPIVKVWTGTPSDFKQACGRRVKGDSNNAPIFLKGCIPDEDTVRKFGRTPAARESLSKTRFLLPKDVLNEMLATLA